MFGFETKSSGLAALLIAALAGVAVPLARASRRAASCVARPCNGGSDYDGPMFIARVLFVAWGLEKKFGPFQGDMLREANRFIRNERPKVLAVHK
jgi:hypothetical protein